MSSTTSPTSLATGHGRSVRILHTGDWQLGMVRHFLDVDAQARFTAARVDAIRRVGEHARAHGCSAVVVAGDVFETNQVSRRVVVRALDAMAEVRLPVLLLPGNHDPLDPASVYRSPTFEAHRPANVVVLDGSAPHVLAPGVEVIAAPWRTKRPDRDLCAAAVAELPADGTLRVLVGHGAVDALSRDAHDRARIRLSDLDAALGDGRIHYVALGDRHSLTDVSGDGRVAYAGAPEPTAFDEVDAGRALVVDVAADGVVATPVEVATWRFATVEARVDHEPDLDALRTRLDQLPDKDTTILRLGLRGAVSIDVGAALDALVDELRDAFAAVEVWAAGSELVRLPDVTDLDALGLVGSSRHAAIDLQQRAADPDGDQARTALDALALLHRLARPAA